MRRIAFFGGSFDPPHRGHLAIARAAADHFHLEQVLFAPVAHQPLKDSQPATAFLHRYAMTALATQCDPRFVPSLLDAPRNPQQNHPNSTPNYTVDTLRQLRASLAAEAEAVSLFTLLGADSWLNIAHWHQPAQLLALSDWIVASRPGFSLAHAENALPAQMTAVPAQDAGQSCLELQHEDGTTTRVWFLPQIQEDVSATELRAAMSQDAMTANLLPEAVEQYIRKACLYC